ARSVPRVVAVDVRLKPGAAHNEMNCFRYDVTLHIGSALGADGVSPELFNATRDTLAEVRQRLASEPPLLALTGLENGRLSALGAARAAAAKDPALTADQLRKTLRQPTPTGIDPAALGCLDDRYELELVWSRSGDASRFDALFRHHERAPKGRWALIAPHIGGALESYANTPAKGSDDGTLTQQLRVHLREFLPEYMVPSTFVLLASFPLTPNGKIDRKALPAPQRQQARSAGEYQSPSNDLEQIISEVWQGLLNVERVGRNENIFDLGANSLLTVQAANGLSARLDRRVSLVSMFRFPTIEALAAHLGDSTPTQAQLEKRSQQSDRKADAAARRRALREGRSG
ncbi:MAG: hypothetical protein RLZZ450_2891, partial [Pseudomonadota bacterium]